MTTDSVCRLNREPVEVGAQARLGELGQLRIKPGGQHVHGGDLGVVLFAELCGAPHGQARLVGQVGGGQHLTGWRCGHWTHAPVPSARVRSGGIPGRRLGARPAARAGEHRCAGVCVWSSIAIVIGAGLRRAGPVCQ